MADHTYNPDGIYLENWLNRNRAERYEAPQDLDLKHQQMAQVGLATDYMKQQLAENPEYDSNGNYTGEDGVWVRKADMLKAFDPNGELSKKLNAPIEQNLYEKSSGEPRGFFENIDESFRRGVERAGVPLLEVPRILGIDAEVGGVPLSDYSRIYHRYLDEQEAEDPVKGDNWFSNSIHGAVGMLPEMTTGILANILAPGSGLAYWSTQGAGDVYDEMEQSGVSREVAIPASVLGGAVYGAIENLQIAKLPGIGPAIQKLKSSVTKRIIGETAKSGLLNRFANSALKYASGDAVDTLANQAYRWGAGKAGKLGGRLAFGSAKTVGGATFESLEELNQELTLVATRNIAYALNDALKGTDLAGQIDIAEDARRIAGAFTESFGPMLLISAAGMGSGAARRALRRNMAGFGGDAEAPATGENISASENIPGSAALQDIAASREAGTIMPEMAGEPASGQAPEAENTYTRTIPPETVMMPDGSVNVDLGAEAGNIPEQVGNAWNQATVAELEAKADELAIPGWENLPESTLRNEIIQREAARSMMDSGMISYERRQPEAESIYERIPQAVAPAEELAVENGQARTGTEGTDERGQDTEGEGRSASVPTVNVRETSVQTGAEESGQPLTIEAINANLRFRQDQKAADALGRAIGGVRLAVVDPRKQVTPDPEKRAGMALIERLGRLFKTRPVLVTGNSPTGFDGAVYRNRVFIDVNSRSLPEQALLTCNHEIVHELKTQFPEAYRRLRGQLEELVEDRDAYHERLERYRRERLEFNRENPQRKAKANLTSAAMREEFDADFIGEEMAKPTFWKKLSARDLPLAKKMLAMLEDIYRRFIGSFRGENRSEADRIFGSNLERAIDAAREFVAQSQQKTQAIAGEGKNGRALFTQAELERFDQAGINVSKVKPQYRAEALQQLEAREQNRRELESPQYNELVRARKKWVADQQKKPDAAVPYPTLETVAAENDPQPEKQTPDAGNIYMRMPLERVRKDAANGVKLAQEALKEREPERRKTDEASPIQRLRSEEPGPHDNTSAPNITGSGEKARPRNLFQKAEQHQLRIERINELAGRAAEKNRGFTFDPGTDLASGIEPDIQNPDTVMKLGLRAGDRFSTPERRYEVLENDYLKNGKIRVRINGVPQTFTLVTQEKNATREKQYRELRQAVEDGLSEELARGGNQEQTPLLDIAERMWRDLAENELPQQTIAEANTEIPAEKVEAPVENTPENAKVNTDGNNRQEQENDADGKNRNGAGRAVRNRPRPVSEGLPQGVSDPTAGNEEAGGSHDRHGEPGVGSESGIREPAAGRSRGDHSGNPDRADRGRGGSDVHAAGNETPSGAVEGELSGVRTGRLPQLTNHRIAPDDVLIPGGDVSKTKANIAAIKLLKELERDDRAATPEEKKILAQYVGWGGLPNVFKPGDRFHQQISELLTPEELAAARASTINAHYTERSVISSMWKLAERLGFHGGKVGEFGAGVGHFLGLIPDSLADQTKFRAVELDSVSGRILQKLYPAANVTVGGLEKTRIANNSLDMVIGNFPFGQNGPYDSRYPRLSLHNYFFARAVDAVKPGGLIVAVTSNSTLDNAVSRKAREWMAERADLVGAIRLPDNAFLKNAGTQVVTDIVILRKKGNGDFAGESFRDTVSVPTGDNSGDIEINEYYARNPEMLLGTLSNTGSMYRENMPTLTARTGQDTAAELEQAVARLPENIAGAIESNLESEAVENAAEELREGEHFIRNNIVYVMQDGKPVRKMNGDKMISERDKGKIRSFINLTGAFNRTVQAMTEDRPDAEIRERQHELERAYDEHVRKYGHISNSRSNTILRQDPNYLRISGLEYRTTEVGENGVRNKVVYHKSDIFSKRTMFKAEEPQSAASASDAATVSLNYRGKIDLPFIAKLIGKDVEQTKKELLSSERFYENPENGNVETAGRYLSGNVVEKLKVAEREAELNPDLRRNVTALEKVRPRRKNIDRIGFTLQSTWMPPEVIERWASAEFKIPVKIRYNKLADKWSVEAPQRHSITAFQVGNADAIDILEGALNLSNVTIYKKNAENKPVVDHDASVVARQYRAKLEELYHNFVMTTPEVAKLAEDAFHEKVNIFVPRHYDLPDLPHYPGAARIVNGKEFKLMDHQRKVVARGMEDGNALIAHCVGAGKTYAMITLAQELKRLKLAHKSLIVVQNATLQQFGESVMALYPNAKVLIADKRDLEGSKRKNFMSRVATGDWDIVVMAHSSFDMIPDKPELVRSRFREEIDALEEAIRETGSGDKVTVKQLEQAKKRLEARMEKLNDRRKDNVLYFDELGIDALFIDEAHEYKKNFFVTKMPNVKGLDKGSSEKAFSLSMKIEAVRQKTGGRNIFLATGTPVTNTLTELWTMVRYVSPQTLRDFNVESFDAFAALFTETVQAVEIDSAGRLRQVERFSKYNNIEELGKFFGAVADVVLPEQLKGVKRPPIKGGKPQNVVVPRSEMLGKLMNYLVDTYSWYEGLSGNEKRENSHIPLVIYTQAKKASIDLRLIDSSMPDDPRSKLNRAVKMVAEKYREYEAQKGAQVVFCDMYQSSDGKFNVYQEIKKKLTALGIPEHEIAVITDYTTDRQRSELFDSVNAGDVRVVIGSTAKLGVGVNMQRRLACAHHLDAPIRPSDMEQRNGRIIRQGNEIPEPEIFNYAIDRTLDAAAYQTLARKDKFIKQAMTGAAETGVLTDEDAESSDYATFAATISGNPKAIRKVELDAELRKLKSMQEQHHRDVFNAKQQIPALERTVEYSQKDIAVIDQVVKEYGNTDFTNLTLEYGDRKITGERKEVLPELDSLLERIAANKGADVSARLNGIPLHFWFDESIFNEEGPRVAYSIEGLEKSRVSHGGTCRKGSGLISSLRSVLANKETEKERAESSIERNRKMIEEYRTISRSSFAQQEKLDELTAENDEIMRELGPGQQAEKLISERPVLSNYLSGFSSELERGVEFADEAETEDIRLSLPVPPGTVRKEKLTRAEVEKLVAEKKNYLAPDDKPVRNVTVSTDRHLKTSEAEAMLKGIAQDPIRRITSNIDTGMVGIITTETARKSRSGKAVQASSVPPYVHAAAMANLKPLFRNAALGVIQQGRYENDADTLDGLYRFYVGMRYEDQQYGVKITAKAYKNGKNTLYSVEAHDIEVFPETAEKKPLRENGEGEKGRPNYSAGPQSHALAENGKGGEHLPVKGIALTLQFKDFFEKFKPHDEIIGEKYRDNPKAQRGRADEEIKLSVTPSGEQGQRTALQYIKDTAELAVNSIKNMKRPDVNGKPDLRFYDTALRTMLYYAERVPALNRIFEAGRLYADNKVRYTNYIFRQDNGDGRSDLVAVETLAKKNKPEYRKLSDYLHRQDVNAEGYRAVRRKNGFEILDPAGKSTGLKFDNEDVAWDEAHKLEADGLLRRGWNPDTVEALLAVRRINDRVYKVMRDGVEQMAREAGELGLKVNDFNGVDIFELLREMGDRRGYYMPRIRHGEYILFAYKDGENPRCEIFDTRLGRSKRAAELEQQGYTTEFKRSETPSEEAFSGISPMALNDVINNALQRMGSGKDKELTLADLGLKAERRSKDGDAILVVAGEKADQSARMMKELGGERNGDGWHFTNPPAGFEKTLAAAVATQSGIELYKGQFLAQELAKQIAIIIHERGSRSPKIGRSDARGEEVYLGYEEDALKRTVLSGRAVAAGTAKSQAAKSMMKAFTGTDLEWRDYKRENMPENIIPGTPEYFKELARIRRDYDAEVNERRIDSSKQPRAYKEALSFMNETLRNSEASERIIGRIRGITAIKYLSRPSSAAINLTAMATNVPAAMNALGHIPLHQTASLLATTSTKYLRFVTGKTGQLTTNDQWLFNEIQKNGWDESQVNEEALRVGNTFAGNGMRALSKWSMIAFSATERFNRAVTIAATYRGLAAQYQTAELTAPKKRELLRQAKDISDKAHGVYGRENLPAWARGSGSLAQAARSFYMFKTFTHNYIQLAMHLIGSRNYKAFAWLMLSPAIVGGMSSSPAWLILKAAGMLGLAGGGGEDPLEAFYRWLERTFGHEASRFGRYGLAGLGGINISGSTGIDIELPKDWQELLGAPWSAIKDVGQGSAELAKGNLLKGMEKILPAAFASPVKAYREATEGITNTRNAPVFFGREQLKLSPAGAVIRGLGFNPADISEKREIIWQDKKGAARFADRRSDIYARYRLWILNGRPQDEADKLIEEIIAYNQAVKASGRRDLPQITGKSLKAAISRSFTPSRREKERARSYNGSEY
ncbi:PLxRFG domain-containing protein [uncultured Victivallis sp.]|uniref:PLxRFG domain-containing protein n=1 Tax=uncultured Victivallis sp. TaxID=354118 RepID=UPI0025988B21|nr:PLxRFG domain-containing protein [uncultured Victivallis sp.]